MLSVRGLLGWPSCLSRGWGNNGRQRVLIDAADAVALFAYLHWRVARWAVTIVRKIRSSVSTGDGNMVLYGTGMLMFV